MARNAPLAHQGKADHNPDCFSIPVMVMRFFLSCALGVALAASAVPQAMAEMRPYLRAGVGAAWSGDSTFGDVNCASRHPAALYGCGDGPDGKPYGAYGDFGSSVQFELAGGLEVTDYLRVELALNYDPGFDFAGNVNFPVPGRQPASADVTHVDAMALTYVQPLAAFGFDSRLQPFFGAGMGLSYNEIGEMTLEFPGLRQPRYSVTPGGSNLDFAWAVSAGLAFEVSDTLVLDVAWRYSDLGTVETDQGTLFNQFSTRTSEFEIGKTEAELTSQSVSVSARFRF
jgi:opacity protein-like surface antigen